MIERDLEAERAELLALIAENISQDVKASIAAAVDAMKSADAIDISVSNEGSACANDQ